MDPREKDKRKKREGVAAQADLAPELQVENPRGQGGPETQPGTVADLREVGPEACKPASSRGRS